MGLWLCTVAHLPVFSRLRLGAEPEHRQTYGWDKMWSCIVVRIAAVDSERLDWVRWMSDVSMSCFTSASSMPHTQSDGEVRALQVLRYVKVPYSLWSAPLHCLCRLIAWTETRWESKHGKVGALRFYLEARCLVLKCELTYNFDQYKELAFSMSSRILIR